MKEGDVVRYWRETGGWATGIVRGVERTGNGLADRRFDLLVLETVETEPRTIHVPPSEVKAWKGMEV